MIMLLNFLQGKEKLSPIPTWAMLLRSLIGGTLSIFVLMMLTKWTGNLYIMAPFGATCVILYAVAQSPLAQPRNVVLGHVVSAFVGLCMLKFVGIFEWSIALAVGLSIVLMQILQCVHPPAGANPLVILLTAPQINYEWSFLLYPVLLGSVSLVTIALCVNNFKSATKWPSHGLGLLKTK